MPSARFPSSIGFAFVACSLATRTSDRDERSLSAGSDAAASSQASEGGLGTTPEDTSRSSHDSGTDSTDSSGMAPYPDSISLFAGARGRALR